MVAGEPFGSPWGWAVPTLRQSGRKSRSNGAGKFGAGFFMQSDFVNRANTEYIDQLYQRYQTDPRSIDPQWREFFSRMDYEMPRPGGNGEEAGRSARPTRSDRPTEGARPSEQASAGTESALRMNDMIHAYRELGHFIANLDPLGHNRPNHPLLELSEFNMTPADLDRMVGQGTFLGRTDGTLRDLLDK